LIDIDTHREVLAWVLGRLAERGLLKGQRMGIDATTLEANAAMCSIVRREAGKRMKSSCEDWPRVEESGRRGRAR
jgi:transposase